MQEENCERHIKKKEERKRKKDRKKTNKRGRQKLDRQNFWQQVKHARLCSDILQVQKGEPWIDLDSLQGMGVEDLNFCVRSTFRQGNEVKNGKSNTAQF